MLSSLGDKEDMTRSTLPPFICGSPHSHINLACLFSPVIRVLESRKPFPLLTLLHSKALSISPSPTQFQYLSWAGWEVLQGPEHSWVDEWGHLSSANLRSKNLFHPPLSLRTIPSIWPHAHREHFLWFSPSHSCPFLSCTSSTWTSRAASEGALGLNQEASFKISTPHPFLAHVDAPSMHARKTFRYHSCLNQKLHL